MSREDVEIKESIYAENDSIAQRIHDSLSSLGIFTVNVMGAPGTGKTSSIIRMLERLPDVKAYVIEGDIQSDIDTKKLSKLGIESVQINTGGECHLDAVLVENILRELNPQQKGLMFIENIGNLVCPAEFNIGEDVKLLVSTVTEGDDKPYKYPLAFEKAGIILLNKSDLTPYVTFDMGYFMEGVRALNPTVPVFTVSSQTGEGFEEVSAWLRNRL